MFFFFNFILNYLINKISCNIRIYVVRPITLHEPSNGCTVAGIQLVYLPLDIRLYIYIFRRVHFHRFMNFGQFDENIATIVRLEIELYTKSPHDFIVYPVS